MSLYKYKAFDKNANKIEAKVEADSIEIAEAKIRESGLTPIDISEDIGSKLKSILNQDIGGIPAKEKVAIITQLSTMISAGVPINKVFEVIIQQTPKESIKNKLQKVKVNIESGNSLSESFKMVKGIFSEVEINLISAGEKSGNLKEVLIKLKNDSVKSKEFKSKLRGAMIYPVIIFVVIVVVIFVMIFFMVPQVKSLYQSLGQNELPGVTNILIGIGEFLSSPANAIIMLILFVLVYVLYKYYYSTKNGKYAIDKLKLGIPVFGSLARNANIADFTKILAMLLSSGLPILNALEIVANSLSNQVFIRTVTQAKKDIGEGASISLSLAKYNDLKDGLPVFLIQMISTGEESGKLVEVLEDLSEYYYLELDQQASNLTKSIEPIILIIVGLMVAFMAVAIYLPIYQAGSLISV